MAASASDVTHFPFQSVLKVDLGTGDYQEWSAPKGCFVGESIFVARAAQASHPRSAATSVDDQSRATVGSGRGSGSSGNAQAEDDGYLVTLMYDGRQDRSSLVLLDAQRLAAGPLAVVHLRTPLPLAFHCMWSSTYHGPK